MNAPCGHAIAQPRLHGKRVTGWCEEGHDFDLEYNADTHAILARFGVPSLRSQVHPPRPVGRRVLLGNLRGIPASMNDLSTNRMVSA